MSNKVIEKIEKDQLKDHPEFRAGDTVEVKVKVTEGQRTRLQAFEGLVISVKKRGLNSAFIVRKISNGVGVERTFQTHSPLIDSIKVKEEVLLDNLNFTTSVKDLENLLGLKKKLVSAI